MTFKPHLVTLSILSAEHWQHSNMAVRTKPSAGYKGKFHFRLS